MNSLQVEQLLERIADAVAEETVGPCFPENAEKWHNRRETVMRVAMEEWENME